MDKFFCTRTAILIMAMCVCYVCGDVLRRLEIIVLDC